MKSLESYLTVPRAIYKTSEIVKTTHLPELHPNKAFLYILAYSIDTAHDGEIVVAQYNAQPIRNDVLRAIGGTTFENECNAFHYETRDEENEWWLNFTGRSLYIAYSGSLFAQEEIQVVEHPDLAHLKEYLSTAYASYPPNKSNPTQARFHHRAYPVLIRGVEQRCKIVDLPSIYGSRFADATFEQLSKAVEVVVPKKKKTNIICMTGLSSGTGTYQLGEILDLYQTAFTAFSGAKNESTEPEECVIHTGHWGCGVFGGNKELITLIQQIAAMHAGIKKLVYHTFNEKGNVAYLAALEKRKNWISEGIVDIHAFLSRLYDENYQWCTMDGQ